MEYKYIRGGSILWILNIQYFIVQIVVAASYIGYFSLAHNTISDLGNTVCGVFGDRYVCSPLHTLMNVSFFSLGATQSLGAMLLYKSMDKNPRSLVGLGGMVAAGLGTMVVGLYPENTIGFIHGAGAALPFVLGNIAMLLLATQLRLPTWLKYYSYFSGLAGLTALVLFTTQTYLGIGLGGMERVVAYPQTIWMILVGIYCLRSCAKP